MFADDEVRFVVGVDPHADGHAVAVVDGASRRTQSVITIPATRRGYQDAVDHADRYAPGARVWAVEGSGSYGAGLAMFLAARGERVVEVERPARKGSRAARLKSDALDAERAAHHVLSGGGATPRLGADTQALRVLVTTRDGAIRARTAALNELRALVLTAPPSLRERLTGLTQARLVDACSRLRCHSPNDAQYQATVLALRLLAGRILHLTQEAGTLEGQISPPGSSTGTDAACTTRRRCDHRRRDPDRLVTPRPHPQRSSLRPPRRRRTNPRQQRQNHPPPTRPRR